MLDIICCRACSCAAGGTLAGSGGNVAVVGAGGTIEGSLRTPQPGIVKRAAANPHAAIAIVFRIIELT